MYKTDLELKIDAARIRIGILKGLRKSGAGHVGGSMSMAELMAVLYGGIMRVRPEQPTWEDRDWLVVSKGHCGPAVYSTLALMAFSPKRNWRQSTRAAPTSPATATETRLPAST
jgi:Transketolase, N-terminal subunit